MSKANPNYTYLKKKVPQQRITLLQGGTRSGKTFSIIYFLINLCLEFPNSGMEIDLVRDTFTALKATAWKDFKTVLIEHGLYDTNYHNKTDHSYNLNGNVISYYGADNPHKIHGRARDLLWVNEAHQFPEETIQQLFPRTRFRIICDYNPAIGLDHWLDEYIIKYPPLITTYKDNPHLTRAQIKDIEDRMSSNSYWWKVYGCGERAPVEGVIFENWEEGAFDDSLPHGYGLDFGFFPDPNAMIKAAVDKRRKIICLKEVFYNIKESTDDLLQSLSNSGISKRDFIVADSSEPRTISDIKKKGYNIHKAKKGPDSVKNGIKKMQSYTLVVDPNSHNLKKELNNYAWNDKKSSTPIDEYNHLLDAARYILERLLKTRSKGVKVR